MLGADVCEPEIDLSALSNVNLLLGSPDSCECYQSSLQSSKIHVRQYCIQIRRQNRGSSLKGALPKFNIDWFQGERSSPCRNKTPTPSPTEIIKLLEEVWIPSHELFTMPE